MFGRRSRFEQQSRIGSNATLWTRDLGSSDDAISAEATTTSDGRLPKTSDVSSYEATESSYPVEFQKIDSSISASDIDSTGSIQAQQVEFTPENFIEEHDVDYKKTSNFCGDLVFSSHHALELHFQGGGAFSSIGVAGLAGLVCWAIAGSASVPTGGASGAAGAVGCSVLATGVDELIDVEMIPSKTALSLDFWDQDGEYPFGINTSPTIAVGLGPGWEVQWHEITKVGEFDQNVHLGF